MYLQGNLQNIFDALYHLGVIDPVLELDWQQTMSEMHLDWENFVSVLNIANQYQSDLDLLMGELKKFDESALSYLAIEVAREFADFHTRDLLH